MIGFYIEHGKEVVSDILKNKPLDATHFVYAYVAKTCDYLRYENGETLVWYRGVWKIITAKFIVESFKDLVMSLSELEDVSKCFDLVNDFNGLDGAKERLKYYDWMPNKDVEYQALKHAIGVVGNTANLTHLIKVAS